MTTAKLKIRNCIAYGVGDLYGGGSFFIVSTFAMYYLVAVVGLSPILAALIPAIGKIWDSISDPLMGYISDKTKSRFGRRRVFFLIAIVPIAVTFSLIWLPVNYSSQWAIFLYYFFAYLFFYTTTTMALVPYSALSAEMTMEFKERNKLTGFRMLFSMLATLIAGVAAQPLINAFPDEKTGHLVMGIIFGLFFAIPWIFVFLGTWELPYSRSESSTIFKNFISMFRNKSFRYHILMYIAAYAAMDILMAWIKFYLADYLQRSHFLSIGLGSILITQILVLPLYIKISNIKGHAFAYRTGLSIWSIAMLLMFFQSPESPQIFLILNCILIGAGLGAGVLVPFQLLPFVADVDEIMTKQKRAGTYAGAMTLLRKLIQGIIVLPTLGILLTLIGYLGPLPGQISEEQLKVSILEHTDSEEAAFIQRAYLEDGLLFEIKEDLSRSDRNELSRIFQKGYNQGEAKTGLFAQLRSFGAVPSSFISSEFATELAPYISIEERDFVLRHYFISEKTYIYNKLLTANEQRDLRKILNRIDYRGFGISKQTVETKQEDKTINALKGLFVLSPLAFTLFGIFISFFFKITPKNHAVLVSEIKRLRDGGGKESVDSESKQICELLTGQSYNDLWDTSKT